MVLTILCSRTCLDSWSPGDVLPSPFGSEIGKHKYVLGDISYKLSEKGAHNHKEQVPPNANIERSQGKLLFRILEWIGYKAKCSQSTFCLLEPPSPALFWVSTTIVVFLAYFSGILQTLLFRDVLRSFSQLSLGLFGHLLLRIGHWLGATTAKY